VFQCTVFFMVLHFVAINEDDDGLTESAGHEIGGPSKLQGMKLQDMKLTDQCAGHEIAGRENGRPICRT